MKADKFRDPIHGFIEVRQHELEIINTKAFQRLRNIKQLAMTYYVYLGAEHTRFGHTWLPERSVPRLKGMKRIFQKQKGNGMNRF